MIPDYLSGPSPITRVFAGGMQEGHSQREDAGTKAEVGEEKRCYVVDFEGREKGP